MTKHTCSDRNYKRCPACTPFCFDNGKALPQPSLVIRLRDLSASEEVADEAADRIEQLESDAKLYALKDQDNFAKAKRIGQLEQACRVALEALRPLTRARTGPFPDGHRAVAELEKVLKEES